MAAISVLMAVYNCDKYLKDAVDSVLNQTWCDFEFIIVDDGSTDDSLKILRGYNDSRLKIITYKDNCGVAHARNIGLNHCSGDYIALMDADDIAFPDRLVKQYEFLREHSDVDGVYAKYHCIDREGKLLKGEWPKAYHNYKYVKAYMLLDNTVANPVSMFRRQIVDENQLKYDETWTISSDYKFWCEFLKYGRIVGMDEVLCYYRLRSHSLYSNAPLSDKRESARRIKLYNFKSYGFKFSQEEEDILIKAFGIKEKIVVWSEIALLYKALLSMAKQAADNKLEFAEEVRIMCKKRFLEKIQEADEIWS